MEKFDLRSIITEEFQNEIQDSFAFATGFGVVFTDAEGNHLGRGGNFCRFCNKINETEVGAKYCALSNCHAIQLALKEKKPSIYICHAGLVNIEIPLIFEGACVGAITAGQVLCNEDVYPKEEVASQVQWLSDPELAAYYAEIEVMSRQKIEATTQALSNLTNYIVQRLAYSQIQEQLAKKTKELLIAENQLKQAKLDALQKQIAPHFIFNVLNSISRLLSMGDYTTAKTMLSAFTGMMRYALSNMQSSVFLEKELAYVENYLSIQKIRFGECMDYQIHCQPELRSMCIPFFSLQPLVENSIEHGLRSREEGGKLTIQCTKQPGCSVITIADNGTGIPPEKLAQIRSAFAHPEEPCPHVGLLNCYRRFQLMYGQRLTFSIESDPGTCITITIQDSPETKKPALDAPKTE